MGRCYEFGVVIAPGCDHAMRVVDEGGRCQCPACGAGCDGRFGGCAAIVAMPGYVPAAAPISLSTVTAAATDAEADVEAEAVVAEAEAVVEPPRSTGDDIAALRAEMHAWLDEVRRVVDEALAEITQTESPPRAVIQLSTLRRRLAALKHQQSAPAEPPPPS